MKKDPMRKTSKQASERKRRESKRIKRSDSKILILLFAVLFPVPPSGFVFSLPL